MDDVAECHSRNASSVGFVEIDDLMKLQVSMIGEKKRLGFNLLLLR